MGASSGGIPCIVNPAAAGGRLRREWSEIERKLRARGVLLDPVWTEGPGHAEELARQRALLGTGPVIAAGGDGTALEVARGLVAAGGGTLAILPVGTGNDAARMLGVPQRIAAWADWLQTAPRSRIDLLALDGTLVLNALGIGLLGSVSARAARMKWFRGPGAYLLAGSLELARAKSTRMILRAGNFKLELPLLALAVQNGSTSGGGFRFCPGARIADGEFDATWVGELPIWRRPAAILAAYRGRIQAIPVSGQKTFAELELENPERTWAHLDGEPRPLEPGTHVVRVLPGALEVLGGGAPRAGAASSRTADSMR